mmetsp:Transcript_23546/g.56448  ORF Transcript_23546/g.56448 Transcript_23546/m.56448 type:complete len:172 (+) Transcript_23546:138-653(+)
MGCGASKTGELGVSAQPVGQDAKAADGSVAEQDKAARAIQQRARGMADRKKVQEQKARGELPGQIREKELTEKEKAALKIQQRARGMADRKKVEEQKKAGALPGQVRQQSAQGGGDAPGATEPGLVSEAAFTPGAHDLLLPAPQEDGLEPLGQDAMSGALASPRPRKSTDD